MSVSLNQNLSTLPFGLNPTDLQCIRDKDGRKSFANNDWTVDIREGGRVHIESKATNFLGQPLTVLDYNGRGQLLKNGKLVGEVSDRIQISLPGSSDSGLENTVISIDGRGLDGGANGYANTVAITAGKTGFVVNGVGKGSADDLGIESVTHRDGEILERNHGLGAVQVFLSPDAKGKGSLMLMSPSVGPVALNQATLNLAHAAENAELNTLAAQEARGLAGAALPPTMRKDGSNKVFFENENYEISVQKKMTLLDHLPGVGPRGGGSLMVHNKKTNETYELWGDPHLNWDDKQVDLFHNTQFTLDDGTVIVAEMEKGKAHPHIDSVTVVDGNGQAGVRIDNVSPKNKQRMEVTENRQDNGYKLLQDLKVRMVLEEVDGAGKKQRGFEVKVATDIYGKDVMYGLNEGFVNDAKLGTDRSVNFRPVNPAPAPANASPESFVRVGDDGPSPEVQWAMQRAMFAMMQDYFGGPVAAFSAWGRNGGASIF